MPKPVWSPFNAAVRVWTALIGAVFKRPARVQGVFLHDPADGRPKNLDNPFQDARAQERVGDLIARATRNPERKPPQ
jgi:hypothetical protein